MSIFACSLDTSLTGRAGRGGTRKRKVEVPLGLLFYGLQVAIPDKVFPFYTYRLHAHPSEQLPFWYFWLTPFWCICLSFRQAQLGSFTCYSTDESHTFPVLHATLLSVSAFAVWYTLFSVLTTSWLSIVSRTCLYSRTWLKSLIEPILCHQTKVAHRSQSLDVINKFDGVGLSWWSAFFFPH